MGASSAESAIFLSSPPKSRFLEYLVASNRPHLDNLQKWLFLPGMLFKAHEKWWGDQGRRIAPHEGLDLCRFAEAGGEIKTLGRYTALPAAFGGETVKIGADFLGRSIYLRHGIFDERGRQLYSAYGHTRPGDFLKIGATVAAGETIATISELFGKKPDVPPHVHLTFAWVPRTVAASDLNWPTLGTHPGITLIDPQSILEIS